MPINGQIKQWAITGPPVGYADILYRWDSFNIARTCCALIAFILVITTVLSPVRDERHHRPTLAEDLSGEN